MTPMMHQTPRGFQGLIGVSQKDITPPVGIYARQWGAAKHDASEGIHRPLFLVAMALREHADAPPLILIGFDGSWFRVPEDEFLIRGGVLDALDLDPARVILNVSHSHAACSLSTIDADKPGGHFIRPYIGTIAAAAREAALEACKTAVPAALTWATGQCDLAINRDLPEPGRDRFVVGYNPDRTPDRTLLVGRATRHADGQVMATVVNYACHPTTLAWDNRLISPDYIGAARETVETHTRAPMLFLLGASGEQSPAHQYVGDTAVADAHGRQLGYAVMSTLSGMMPHGQQLAYTGAVESGACLGIWQPVPLDLPGHLDAFQFSVDMPLKPLPPAEDIQRELAACKDRVMAERLNRKLAKVKLLGSATTYPNPVWVWRVGNSLFVAHPQECYSQFQRDLRAQFSDEAVAVINLANSASLAYVYPPEIADDDIYQVWVSPFERDALPHLTQACIEQIADRRISKT